MVWVGEQPQEIQDAYDGLFIVMNIGKDTLVLPEVRKAIEEKVAEAHAGGWLTLHIFDMGVEPPPDFMDPLDGLDLGRPSKNFGKPILDFKLLPEIRAAEFALMAAAAEKEFNVKRRVGYICGACKIDGSPVMLPPTPLPWSI